MASRSNRPPRPAWEAQRESSHPQQGAMDNIPIEYRDRMLVEQMALMETLQFIAQLLICFALLVAFLILIINLIEAVGEFHNSANSFNTKGQRIKGSK
jgi:hypothetical protein